MSIQRLPDEAIAQINSSATITSLNGVVDGLVRNSLDSGATKITVSVDYGKGGCTVEDDGLGIPPTEFKPGGSLGKLHHTSKQPARENVHGRYGTFLASLASLSLLSITSHHSEYRSHNSIRIHNSHVLSRHTPSPPDSRVLSFPHGTRVTVRDLFGSMPVRVKQRAVGAERGHHSRDWEVLRRAIVALVLSWNGPISISAREAGNGWAFAARGSNLNQEADFGGTTLAARISRVLFHAGLSEDNNSETWIPLKASAGAISVTGAVSLCPVATKRVQFISIGVRPVPNEHGSNVLYEEINRIFSNSTYGVEEESEDLPIAERERRAKDGRYNKEGFTSQELRGRKGVDRWPMFYLRIQHGTHENSVALQEIDEILNERHGGLAAIVDTLKAVTYEFLKKYQFHPKRIRKTRDSASRQIISRSNSPSATPRQHMSTMVSARGRLAGDLATTQLSISCNRKSASRSASPFALWSRVKSSSPYNLPGGTKLVEQCAGGELNVSNRGIADPNTHAQSSEPNSKSLGGSLLRTASIADSSGDNEQPFNMGEIRRDEGIHWTNPATGEVSMLDPRTGFIIRPKPSCQDGVNGESCSATREKIGLHSRSGLKENKNVWLEELLSSWDNPIFRTTEPQIPCAYSEGNLLGGRSRPLEFNTAQEFLERGSSTQGRVSRAALQNAEVIAQVDRKFILARVMASSNTASLLIMIDQHAADERCRVESLMKDYFKIEEDGAGHNSAETWSMPTSEASLARTELLEQPIKFDVSPRDAAQFERTTKHFAYWGIQFRIARTARNDMAEHRQLHVTRLPPSIAERCRLEPRLLIELLRKEAWQLDERSYQQEGNRGREHLEAGNDERAAPLWVTQFHGCPEGILDMINSRACRSSIMFNDPLSPKECVDLLQRLADCAFPFQCAHGRPSMVPLVDIGDNTAVVPVESNATGSFAQRFKTWSAGG